MKPSYWKSWAKNLLMSDFTLGSSLVDWPWCFLSGGYNLLQFSDVLSLCIEENQALPAPHFVFLITL